MHHPVRMTCRYAHSPGTNAHHLGMQCDKHRAPELIYTDPYFSGPPLMPTTAA